MFRSVRIVVAEFTDDGSELTFNCNILQHLSDTSMNSVTRTSLIFCGIYSRGRCGERYFTSHTPILPPCQEIHSPDQAAKVERPACISLSVHQSQTSYILVKYQKSLQPVVSSIRYHP